MIGAKIKSYLEERGIKQAFLVEKTGLHNLSIYSKCDADALVSIIVDRTKIASGRISSSEDYSTSVIKHIKLKDFLTMESL